MEGKLIGEHVIVRAMTNITEIYAKYRQGEPLTTTEREYLLQHLKRVHADLDALNEPSYELVLKDLRNIIYRIDLAASNI